MAGSQRKSIRIKKNQNSNTPRRSVDPDWNEDDEEDVSQISLPERLFLYDDVTTITRQAPPDSKFY